MNTRSSYSSLQANMNEPTSQSYSYLYASSNNHNNNNHTVTNTIEEDTDKASVISADSDCGLVAPKHRNSTSVTQFLMGVFGRYTRVRTTAGIKSEYISTAPTVPFKTLSIGNKNKEDTHTDKNDDLQNDLESGHSGRGSFTAREDDNSHLDSRSHNKTTLHIRGASGIQSPSKKIILRNSTHNGSKASSSSLYSKLV